MIVADAAAESRARRTLGSSGDAIYQAVASTLAARDAGGVLVDVGCGAGNLWRTVGHRFTRCVGLDLVDYDGRPPAVEFRQADLDRTPFPVADSTADVVAAVETIEHLENPRAFVRELARIVRPGGWVIVTTPNQLSGLSLLTLAVKQRFSAFQDSQYPAHRTALLEVDLRRIAAECDLREIDIGYTCAGRMPLTGAHYPRIASRLLPRLLSDNVLLAARKQVSGVR
jgi:2-polyprenyl-3-methyl-5-hydroxy-6-metoxy-1,4-benzoquinol methylase